jgi:hypothetical protein
MKLWKLQKFFGDVVYDLRNKGLLPVVILLVVAMVAVPVVISRGGSDSSSPSATPTAAMTQQAPETEQAVLAYSPAGLRKYKERLKGLSPKDPFRQQFDAAAATAAASALESTVPTIGGTTETSSSSTIGPTEVSGGDTGSSPATSTGGTKKKSKKKKSSTNYFYEPSLLMGEVNAPTLTPYNKVQPMTALPSPELPVVVYFGLNSDNKRALFLVSNRVTSVSGQGTCIPAPDDCSLLYLAKGQSEDLSYSVDGKTYRLSVADIKRFTK